MTGKQPLSGKSDFHKRLRSLRKERGYTQSSLAKKLGISATCVGNWENDITFPRDTALNKLAKTLETSRKYLIDGSGPPLVQAEAGAEQVTATASLSVVIEEARESVASAAGLSLSQVRVLLDYGG